MIEQLMQKKIEKTVSNDIVVKKVSRD